MTFLFVVERAIEAARVRIKSERGEAVRVSDARFGRVAALGNEIQSAHTAPPIKHVCDLGEVSLYQIAGAQPLVRWAPKVTPAPDTLSAVEMLQKSAETVDLPGSAVVEWAPETEVPPPGRGELSIRRPSPDEVVVTIENAGRGLLVFNETFDAGWRATIDGESTPIHRVNAVAQGVVVESGAREVRFRYRPRGLRAGAVLSGAGWLVLAGSCVIRRRVRAG
jgi:hypothetical protein